MRHNKAGLVGQYSNDSGSNNNTACSLVELRLICFGHLLLPTCEECVQIRKSDTVRHGNHQHHRDNDSPDGILIGLFR